MLAVGSVRCLALTMEPVESHLTIEKESKSVRFAFGPFVISTPCKPAFFKARHRIMA